MDCFPPPYPYSWFSKKKSIIHVGTYPVQNETCITYFRLSMVRLVMWYHHMAGAYVKSVPIMIDLPKHSYFLLFYSITLLLLDFLFILHHVHRFPVLLTFDAFSKLSVRAFACGRLDVRIPAATDRSRKTGSDSSTAKRRPLDVSVTVPRRRSFKRMSLAQQLWHVKEPSMINDHKLSIFWESIIDFFS